MEKVKVIKKVINIVQIERLIENSSGSEIRIAKK